MLAPVEWLCELVGLLQTPSGEEVAADLVRVGLEEESIVGGEITGPLVVGKVLDVTDEPQKNGKTIHFCHVDVGDHGQRAAAGGDPSVTQEIVCGAHNFSAGDHVVCILPGGVLPGDFAISARKTYGHMSNGMICSSLELGLGQDHDGIIVLEEMFADRPEVLASLKPGDDAIPLLGLDAETVEVNVTPDRGYCFSMRGIAREYALSRGLDSFRDPAAVETPAANDTGYPVRLVDDAPIHGRQGCDRYVARIVRGVDPAAPTPAWMADRLTRSGMRPISLTVDVTNYLMLLTGQPLHAFDLDTLSGSIEVRRAHAGETLRTLDDVERTLDTEDLLITDGGETPLAIAGVMGGETSEVSGSTSAILVEAAHFDPVTVARSSRRHKFSTEASRRFERGVDPRLAPAVAQLAVDLLVELGGGIADAGVTDVDETTPVAPIAFHTREAWRLVEPGSSVPGTPVPAGLDHEAVVAALRAIGCEVADAGEADADSFRPVEVAPPSWRPDLATGPDLVEEIARLRGYDRIPAVLPSAPSGRGLTARQRSTRLVGTALAGLGLTEVLSYPFVGEATFDRFGYQADDARRRAVRIANPLSDEAPLMRTSLLDSLLPMLRVNVGRGAGDVSLFECGLVFHPRAEGAAAPVPPVGERPSVEVLEEIDAAVPEQPRHLAAVLAGQSVPLGPWGEGRVVEAADAIGLAIELGRVLGVELRPEAARYAPWHPGRCAAIRAIGRDGTPGEVVGHAGELHPKVCAAVEVPARTCALELDLDAVLAVTGGAPVQGHHLSTYPVARTDVALVVDTDVPAGDVARALREGAGETLESLTLFDVYEGDQLPEGKKSLAYRLTFRAADRTLKTGQVSAMRDDAVASARRATGAEIRGPR
ncbi:phenylalanine--tRNA ligase subunit beta [Mobilicoccus pelagius]|uniref:Phenylalanine--tRNA ligase beta subunit n=1 Tax=Mobilicoccus pelagius NBRC 104925 TaxID=1089455 RepID=H5UPI4_9MICO|nr:phenylalanine--tRNA ligase subunit beta [Mobilicoccus pelagius]GAB47642.1 phenylalanyl-tRNA synthetase beta chain [Mobilicoccus pelagius NBRC 104925]